MNNKIKLTLSLLLTLLILPLQAQDAPQGIQFIEGESFDSILLKAKAADKLIFIDTYAEWCGPCKMLAANVFPDKEAGEFFNANLINVKYDAEKGEGKVFYQKYKESIPGYPTMLLINSDGEVVHTIVGYRDAPDLIQEVKDALSGKTLSYYDDEYAKGERDIDFINEYFKVLEKAYRLEDAQKVLEEFRADLPIESLLEPKILEMAKGYILDPYSEDYRFIINNSIKTEGILGADMPALRSQLDRGMRNAVDDILSRYSQKDVQQATIDSVAVLESILRTNIVRRSPDMLGKFRIAEFFRNGDAESVFHYIAFANGIGLYNNNHTYLQRTYNYLVDNIDNSDMLEVMVKDVADIQKKEDEKSFPSNFYSTIATIHQKLGNKEEAEEAQKKYEELQAKNDKSKHRMIQIISAEKKND